jgi:hypothetical protein
MYIEKKSIAALTMKTSILKVINLHVFSYTQENFFIGLLTEADLKSKQELIKL